MTDPLTQTFAAVLKLDPNSLTDETSPENTPAWDSLRALQLVTAIEETFNVELATTDILRMRNLGMVRNVLRRKGVTV
ncbi:MAG TPA: acyl carrier protein [Candidatus Binatia bacterium]|jgi:acyl carrier protein